jgi:hypothetical protein
MEIETACYLDIVQELRKRPCDFILVALEPAAEGRGVLAFSHDRQACLQTLESVYEFLMMQRDGNANEYS